MLRRARNRLVHEHGLVARQALSTVLMQSAAMLDTTKWAKTTSVDGGIIDWRAGESLFATARLALTAAAKATKEKRKYFGNSSSHIAKRLLDETLMGQTEIGSFVVTAYTPSGGRFFFSKTEEDATNTDLLDAKSRTGGEIIDNLVDIVSSVRESLDAYRKSPRIEQFDELVQEGLSFEMASSLSRLCDASDGRLRVERARSTGVHPNPTVHEFEFLSTESTVLETVARRFSETREPRSATLVGEVSLLDHLSTADTHTIRLHVSNQPDIRVVRIQLTPEQYKLALEAHSEEEPLVVSGVVEREKRTNWVYSPTTVTLQQNPASNGDSDLGLQDDEPPDGSTLF